MSELTAPARFGEIESSLPTPPRSRGRRWSTRIATVATAAAMGSWALIVVIPVVALACWL